MKLSVKLESYALCGSGEGSGLIDSDVVHDLHGVPYLPGRRFKGLLRESALEVIEWLGTSQALVAYVFGNDGFQPGTLRVPNLYPQGYHTWADVLPVLLKARHNTLINPAAILSEFCSIRQQTSIDNETGTARNASLRTTRVLKPGMVFECDLNAADPAPSVSALLWLAAGNLRRFGTGRNRGQGTISCDLSPSPLWKVQGAIEEIAKWSAPADCVSRPAADWVLSKDTNLAKLQMTIRTRSPVVLAESDGDMNTVKTARAISGATVKGILVDRVRQALGLQKGKEHESALFRRFFLEQGENMVHASPAFPVIGGALFTPAPLHMHRDKNQPLIHNLLVSQPADTKPIHGYVSLKMPADNTVGILKDEPETTLFFHHRRSKDRKQGKSSEEDGAIFYYEALEKDQEFRAILEGPKELLDVVLSFGPGFSSSIGRSRSAQYGQADVMLSELPETEKDEEVCDLDTTLLTCLSPLIFRNRFGFPEASAENLKHCLAKALSVDSTNVEVTSAHARTTTVEPYVGVIGCRLPACEAFREGSSFGVKISGVSEDELSSLLKSISFKGLGELCAMGFGSVVFSSPPGQQSFRELQDALGHSELPEAVPDGLKNIIARIVCQKEETYITEQGIGDAGKYQSRLHNHQIGRIETIVEKAKALDSLRDTLDSFRDTVRKKLTAFQTGDRVSIWERIYDFSGPINGHLDKFREEHRRLFSLAGVPDPTDEDRFKLARSYWLALLRRLRKLNKKEAQ